MLLSRQLAAFFILTRSVCFHLYNQTKPTGNDFYTVKGYEGELNIKIKLATEALNQRKG
jgi:hypothetical protein